MTIKIIPFLCLFLFIVFNGCKKETEQPINKPAFELSSTADIPFFNGESAYKHVANYAEFGARVPNTKAHTDAKNYILSIINKYADKVVKQDFTISGYDGVKLDLTNIIASFNPAQAKRILICTHWDSRPWADAENDTLLHKQPVHGVNDGGSGVGIMLEAARILKEKQPNIGVDLLFVDGEDYGKSSDLSMFCLGSKYFAATKNDYHPAFGILLDLVGDKEAKFYKEENSINAAEDVVDLFWDAAAKVSAVSFVNQNKYSIYDDHIPLIKNGIRTIDIIDAELVGADKTLGRRAYWHTLKDDLSNIGQAAITDVGNTLIYFIYSLQINE